MSSSEEEFDQEVEDEEFNQAFGEHTGIDEEVREYINDIKENNDEIEEFKLSSDDTENFTNLAWTLLGRYIANNIHLVKIDLESCSLTDEKMALLFKELDNGVSLERLDANDNDFGIEGVRSMIPLLQNSPNLSRLYFGGNRRIDSESFGVLIRALNRRSTRLSFQDCNITDISALNSCNLPNLQILNLNGNKIGREGCITISNLLQKEGSTLKSLYLRDIDIRDDGSKIIAASLKHNKKLQELYLTHNNLTIEGYVAFLELVIDITSIESTYTSNHTLEQCKLDDDNDTYNEIQTLVDDICEENGRSNNLVLVPKS